MIKLIIVDDHQLFIDGIKSLLKNEKEIKVVGEALNGIEAMARITEEKPDIILLDINMPDMDGVETTREIRKKFPEVKIIILTMHNQHEFISNLVSEGALGYILKNTGKTELINAIKTVHGGNAFFSKAVTETIMNNLHKKPAEEKLESVQLTKREKEILKYIAEGLATKEIADKLFISVNTVETHRKNLMAKVHAKNVTGLVRFAMQIGIIS
jgi:two-component system, NarL family, nitrate/nitrite response regulator NarL